MRALRIASWLLLVLALLAGAGFWAGLRLLDQYLTTAGPLTSETIVVLPPGVGLAGIAERLASAEAIGDPLVFRLAARWIGKDRSLKAGEYRIDPGATPLEILELLEAGKVLLHRLTVAEGLTVAEVWKILEESEVLVGPLPPRPVEGTVLPETYLFSKGESRAKLAERMRVGMASLLAEAWAARPSDLKLASPEEALILASIIEKETALAEEYPLVAAVFHNRLRRSMRLQSDPTVIYGITKGEKSLGRALTRADLEAATPYNTYKIDSLPPGPIANPGRGAIEAALAPADVDYLYFVADGSGGHAFANSLAEHNRNVQRWRRLGR